MSTLQPKEREEVIKFLSEWLIKNTPGKVPDVNIPLYMGITALVMDLKGVKGEWQTIEMKPK